MLLAVVGWKALLSEAATAPLRFASYGFGSVAFVGVLFLKPRLISAEVLASVARQRGTDAALALLHTRLVTLLATSEFPAVLGFLLFLLGGVLSDFYVLWAVSLVGHLILAPRRELWEAVARAGARV